MDRRTYCMVSGTIFGVVAALHVVRLVRDWDIEIGSYEVPRFVSYPGAVAAGALAAWGFQAAKKQSFTTRLLDKFS